LVDSLISDSGTRITVIAGDNDAFEINYDGSCFATIKSNVDGSAYHQYKATTPPAVTGATVQASAGWFRDTNQYIIDIGAGGLSATSLLTLSPSTGLELRTTDWPVITITVPSATPDQTPQIQYKFGATPAVVAAEGYDFTDNSFKIKVGSGGIGGSNQYVFTSTSFNFTLGTLSANMGVTANTFKVSNSATSVDFSVVGSARYRATFNASASGLNVSSYDDTGAVFMPSIYNAADVYFLSNDVAGNPTAAYFMDGSSTHRLDITSIGIHAYGTSTFDGIVYSGSQINGLTFGASVNSGEFGVYPTILKYDAHDNCMVGHAGTPTTGYYNFGAMGNTLGGNSSGNGNTGIGWAAGASNVSGSYNVFLGYAAGYWETGSNKLYIANSTYTNLTALIYGEFDNAILRINGSLGIGCTPGDMMDILSTITNGNTGLRVTAPNFPAIRLAENTASAATAMLVLDRIGGGGGYGGTANATLLRASHNLEFFTGTTSRRVVIQSGGDMNFLGDVKIGGSAGDNPSAALQVVGDMICSGVLNTSAGSDWDFGVDSSSAPIITDSILRVTVNSVKYDVPCKMIP
jgi:hypothetical protein